MRLEIDARNLGEVLGHRRIVIYELHYHAAQASATAYCLSSSFDAKYLHTHEELVDFCRAPTSTAPLPSPHIIRLNCRATQALVRR